MYLIRVLVWLSRWPWSLWIPYTVKKSTSWETELLNRLDIFLFHIYGIKIVKNNLFDKISEKTSEYLPFYTYKLKVNCLHRDHAQSLAVSRVNSVRVNLFLPKNTFETGDVGWFLRGWSAFLKIKINLSNFDPL